MLILCLSVVGFQFEVTAVNTRPTAFKIGVSTKRRPKTPRKGTPQKWSRRAWKERRGKEGGTHKNPWRPHRGHTNSNTPLAAPAPARPFTELHHNNEPLVVCFLSDEQRATECKQCGTAFPRRLLLAPYDIVLPHSEKWLYPDPKCPANKLPSSRHTAKYYCIKEACVMKRFPHFNSKYFEIPVQIDAKLKDAHRNLIKEELGCWNCNDCSEVCRFWGNACF